MMVRVTIYISDAIKTKLEELSKIEGRSVVELIREAIADLLRRRGMLEMPPRGD